MATRVCPRCGSQYVASVRRCIDCDLMLEEAPPDDDGGGTAAGSAAERDGYVAYELEGWGNQLKVSLAGMLDTAGIPGVWESGALLVPAAAEEAVDDLLATVEGTSVAPDEDRPRVAFDLEDVTGDELHRIEVRLVDRRIVHGWDDDGALVVDEDDEAAVTELIDQILNDEDPDEDDDAGDGLATLAALSQLYVAVDKLHKDPLEARLVVRFAEAAEGLDDLDVPYGYPGDRWRSLLELVADLRRVVEGSADDEELAQLDDAHPTAREDGDGEEGDDDGDEGEAGGGVIDRDVLARDLAVALRDRLREVV